VPERDRPTKHTFGNLGPNSCEAIGVLRKSTTSVSSSLGALNAGPTSPKVDLGLGLQSEPGPLLFAEAHRRICRTPPGATQQKKSPRQEQRKSRAPMACCQAAG